MVSGISFFAGDHFVRLEQLPAAVKDEAEERIAQINGVLRKGEFRAEIGLHCRVGPAGDIMLEAVPDGEVEAVEPAQKIDVCVAGVGINQPDVFVHELAATDEAELPADESSRRPVEKHDAARIRVTE